MGELYFAIALRCLSQAEPTFNILTAKRCPRREVVTQQYPKAASQNVTLTATGADALIHMDAWAMAASVTGGPELCSSKFQCMNPFLQILLTRASPSLCAAFGL